MPLAGVLKKYQGVRDEQSEFYSYGVKPDKGPGTENNIKRHQCMYIYGGIKPVLQKGGWTAAGSILFSCWSLGRPCRHMQPVFKEG